MTKVWPSDENFARRINQILKVKAAKKKKKIKARKTIYQKRNARKHKGQST